MPDVAIRSPLITYFSLKNLATHSSPLRLPCKFPTIPYNNDTHIVPAPYLAPPVGDDL